MKKSNIRKFWSINETATSFIFTNSMNFHIELDKLTGSFINGNVHDNEAMRKQFKLMMQVANELKK
jgi:hypothetical protein